MLVGQPGNGNGTAQSNNASANAQASAAANGTAGANASAAANANAQATQDNPSNLNVTVRVNSPGNDGAVNQVNTAEANANARVDTAIAAAAAARAAAAAAQTAAQNINVAVRVGSPGDQGPVSQSNNAVATAGNADGTDVQVPTAPDAISAVTNDATLDQQLAQCPQSACTPGQAPTSDPAAPLAAGTTDTTATATQTAPSNVNVSVRVASPGTDGQATQTSEASATGATASATTTGGDNLNVAVVVPSSDPVTGPNSTDPWTWTWNWSGETVPATPDAASTASSDWNWNWASAPAPAAPTAATAGHWIWTWTWTRSDGSSVSYTSDLACSCEWVWTWTWDWDTPPPSLPPVAPPEGASPPDAEPAPQVTQSNTATATATAGSSTTVTQTSDPGETATSAAVDPSSTADQSISSSQVVQASASALQNDVTNFSFVGAGDLESLSQGNEAGANAGASAELVAGQAVVQSQSGAVDGVLQVAQAAQSLVNQQIAQASAIAQQTATRNASRVWAPAPTSVPIGAIAQSNTATATAVAADQAEAQQVAFQTQAGAGQEQTAQAGQLFANSQTATAAASSSQVRVANLSDVLIPAGGISNPSLTQSNELSTAAVAANSDQGSQTVVQAAAGQFVVWHETASQAGSVRQGGDSGSGLSSVDRTNVAGWRGLIAGPAGAPAPTLLAAPSAEPDSFLIDFPAPPVAVVVRTVLFPTAPAARKSPRAPAPRASTAKIATATSQVAGAHFERQVPAATPLVLSVTPGSFAALPALGADTGGGSLARSRGSNLPSPFCPPSCGNGSFGMAFGGAGGAASGSFVATLAPFRLFAAPGAGWLRIEAPDLGRPADTAPIEHPG